MKNFAFSIWVIGILLTSWAFGKGPEASSNPWIRITNSSIPMDQQLIAACAPPGPIRYTDHPRAEADIFANHQAIEYRKNNPQKYKYPVGSMFLKTKYSEQYQKLPDEFGTLIIKKANTGKITDWEFSIMNVKTGQRQLPSPQHLRNCINCHEGFSGRGYLSRESEMALGEHLGWRGLPSSK